MAFYPGVQMSKEHPWDTIQEFLDHLDDWNVAPGRAPGSMRMIFFGGSGKPGDLPDGAARLIQGMQDAGFFVIATVQPNNQSWSTTTAAQYANFFSNTSGTGYIDKGCSPDAWSLGNEPGTGTAGQGATYNGPYWSRAKAAADRIRTKQPGADIVLGAPRHDQRTPFFNAANTWGNNNTPIPQWVDAFDVHVYANTPDQSLTAVENVRTQVDAFSAGWAAMPMYITEFGYGVWAAAGEYHNLVVGGTQVGNAWIGVPGSATDTTQTTQAGFLWKSFTNWINNRAALKLRAATWYVASDLPFMGTGPNDHVAGVQGGFCGLQKTRANAYVQYPPPGDVNDVPVLNTGEYTFRAAYHRLTNGAFADVYDAAAATAPDITYPVPPATSVTQTSATLRATVDPNSQPTTRFFEWGLTTSYGNVSPGVGVGSGTTGVNVFHNIPAGGLQAGRTYHFRCYATNSQTGRTNGADKTFTTDVPPLPPTATTGSATDVTKAGATLNAVVDDNNGGVTTAYFEYGLTTSYGTPSPNITVPNGSGPTSISATVTGLNLGTTYHYRVRASNATGAVIGTDRTFITTAPAVSTATEGHPVFPSLDVSVEIQTADGRTYRWDQDAADPRNRPYELSFGTAAGDGFAEASCVVFRPIELDWPDIKLLVRGRFIGADGQIAYEGRVAGIPRSIDDSGERIEVQFQGLMASTRDRPFMEVYADRSGDRWQQASLNLRTAYAVAQTPLDHDYTPQVDSGSLSFKGWAGRDIVDSGGTDRAVSIPVNSQGVLMYQAPSGVLLSKFQYKGDDKGTSISNCEAAKLHSTKADSDNADGFVLGDTSAWATSANFTMNNVTQPSVTVTPPARFLGLRLRCGTKHRPSTENAAHRIFYQVCVYGNHDVPLRDNGTEPDGVWASDVMADIIDRFCPLLDASEIEGTEAMIEHLVFDSPTYPYDAFTLLNGFHLWLLAGWESGADGRAKVMFEPADLTKADWLVSNTDPGVTVDLHGDTTDEFANGIVVSYTDVAERQQVLWPDAHVELRDQDPDNPANREGITKWTTLELSNPATQAMALSLGETALAEFNRPKRPGTVTVTGGYILDATENPRPAHEVRYGQTLSIIDFPNESPNLITATSWSEDGQLTITLEQPPTRVDAVLARLELASSLGGTG